MATKTVVVSAGFRAARRLNRSVTAAAEKRALVWMAERAPRWATSDGLTVLGLSAQVGGGICYAMARHGRGALAGAIACILLNWLGDSLDGTLARVRRQQRPRYGFYVDHVVDIFGATALLAGLGASGLLHWQAAAAMLVAFLLLAGESYLATYTVGDFEMSQGFLGPTEIRILLITGTAVAGWRSGYATVFGHRLLLFDVGGAMAAAGMLVTVIVVAARHTAALYRLEPLS